MKALRVLTFFAVPLTATACIENNPKIEVIKNITTPKDINFTETSPVAKLKLKELSEEQNKALDEMEHFHKTYGDYNYESIPQFLTGLREDHDGLIKGADDSEKQYVEDYINGKLDFFTKPVVIYEINRKGTEQIEDFLKEMGVKKLSSEASGDSNETLPLVTRDELLKFRFNARIVRNFIESNQFPGTKVCFPNGFNEKLTRSVRERITALPEGVEIAKPPIDTLSLK